MKRSFVGVLLLIALLLVGIVVQNKMEQMHRPVARLLDLSAQSALSGDWDGARSLSGGASDRWQQSWKFSAAFADHEPMEEIDSLFSRMEVFSGEEDGPEFAAACRELARRIDAMADAHVLNWWNLF